MDDDNHSCPQFPRYTSNFALASFLLCASILMLHLKTVFRAGCALAFMFEKDGAVWQTCQGVISSSASGDNCTSLPASTSTRMSQDVDNCKLQESTSSGQSSPCSADPVSWERHSFISQLPALLRRILFIIIIIAILKWLATIWQTRFCIVLSVGSENSQICSKLLGGHVGS